MPTDQGLVRTFPNDPAPPPDVSVIPDSPPSVPLSSPVQTGGASVIPNGGKVKTSPSKNEGTFWASSPDTEGYSSLFNTTPDGEDHEVGRAKNITPVLDSLVKRNPIDGSWRELPKDIALSFPKGDVGMAEHIINSFQGARAGMHEGMTGYLALTKQMPYDEAIARTDPDLVKMQLMNFPDTAWGDTRYSKMIAGSKWALGAAAQILPSQIGNLGAGAESLPIVAAGAAGVASLSGPAGLSALITPAGISSVAGVAWQYGAFDFTSKVTSGQMALEMKRKGLDDKSIATVAPMAGMFAGALEVMHVKLLPAPFRRAFAAKVLGNSAVKKAMTHWFMNYLKETGAETSVEIAQQYIQEYGNNLIAKIGERPDLMKTKEQINASAIQAGLVAAVGMGLVKGPGMAFEAFAGGEEGKPAGVKTPAAELPVQTPSIAPATTLEQSLVAETPEVAKVLSDLNTQLDPLAQDAEITYAEVGKELAGHEDAAAAIVAKTEALRMEMSDILAEEGNTPYEQTRVGEIQHELELLEGMQAQMTVSEGQIGGEFQSGDSVDVPMVESGAPISKLKQRVESAVLKARDKKLASEMKNNSDMTAELMRTRDRLEKAGKPTLGIDNALHSLQTEALRLDEVRRGLNTPDAVTSNAKLELTPATLDSITKLAFKEGRKDVVVKRAGFINEIAEQHSLSDHDVKTLTKNRNLGIMSDGDFKKYLDNLRVDAKELAERKQALSELHATQDAKELKKEANIRRFHDLPPVAKMTKEQMQEYASILEGYETGDEFWTPARILALKDTRWAGAATLREVLEMAAKHLNVPLSELTNVTASQFDIVRGDVRLAKRGALYDFMVREVNDAQNAGRVELATVIAEHHKLVRAALKSRHVKDSAGLWEKVVDWLSPTNDEVLAYIEAPTAEAKASLGAGLTNEELALADFYSSYFKSSMDYLTAGEDMESSRFTGGRYFPHLSRPSLEIFLRSIPDKGVRGALSDLWTSWKANDMEVDILPKEVSRKLGMRKAFAQTKFRTGELIPSKNLARSFDVYAHQFTRKKALDSAVPSVDTLAQALASIDRSEDGQKTYAAVQSVIKTYLNSKKGINPSVPGIPQGGTVDAVIRGATAYASLKLIAPNLLLQGTMWGGEKSGEFMAIGGKGMALAQYRKMTPQGKLILKKYEQIIGEGVWENLTRPGQDLTARANTLMYGIAKQTRVSTMKGIILGSMTPEEFAAGEMTPGRLTEVKLAASRWVDIEGMHSPMGNLNTFKMLTQFKRWLAPVTATSMEISRSLVKSLTGMGASEKLNAQQKTELLRLAELGIMVGTTFAVAGGVDKDDKSMLGRAKLYILRDLSSMFQGINLGFYVTVPVAMTLVVKISAALTMLPILIAQGEGAKGVKRLAKEVLPRQFIPADDKKKGPSKPYRRKD